MSKEYQNCGGLFEMILKDQNVSMYIHPDIENRIPIQLVTQGLCDADLYGDAFGHPIQFNPSNRKDTVFFLTKFDTQDNNVNFELQYDVEGIKISGNAVYSASIWAVSDLVVFEQ